MEPHCHPKLENNIDLETQQAAFFDSSWDSSATLVKSSRNSPHRPVVLSEVVERDWQQQPAKPVLPPTARPPPQPKLFSTPPNPTSEHQEISQQNVTLLHAMSDEQILALQEEMRASVPESFLRKLENKRI
jgi:hypothetical protein